jgi:hypothetical protein
MKRIIYFITLLLIPVTSFSQKMNFSFIASPQITWFSGNDDNYEANGNYFGFNTGLEVDFFFSENYAFSTGLTINSLKGGAIYADSLSFGPRGSAKILIPGSKLRFNMQYITVPLGLKFKTIEIGYSTYWLNTGVNPMIRIKSSATDEQEVFSKTDFKDETRLFNMGYFIEGGLEYSLGGNTALIAGLGYNSGFIDVTSSSENTFYTRSFSVILGILF